MATYITPGLSEIVWVTTIADTTAITAAEANAGVDITPFVREMPTIPRGTNLSDNTDISSTFESRNIGTRGGDVVDVIIKRHKAVADDTAYTTLTEDTAGFLLVGRQGLAAVGTWAAADRYDLFPATVSSLEDGTPGRNDIDTAIVHLAITSAPTRDDVIAA
ncbi:hypothetical protein LCGC14_2315510 [marine sediment metagenome]|uniref:Uncharacterized protein n=1 Tax=marine sediment metagenome TaxID=412755 RepID=A0A0F9CJY2_9ZZZZ